MLALTIREKNGEERQLIFDKEEVTIGRATGSDIVLPRSNISKRHARLVDKHDKVVIVDLRSTNGTYVNGRRITAPELLTYDDKVYIGDFVIRLSRPAEQHPSQRMTAPYSASPTPMGDTSTRGARAATQAVDPPMAADLYDEDSSPPGPPPMETGDDADASTRAIDISLAAQIDEEEAPPSPRKLVPSAPPAKAPAPVAKAAATPPTPPAAAPHAAPAAKKEVAPAAPAAKKEATPAAPAAKKEAAPAVPPAGPKPLASAAKKEAPPAPEPKPGPRAAAPKPSMDDGATLMSLEKVKRTPPPEPEPEAEAEPMEAMEAAEAEPALDGWAQWNGMLTALVRRVEQDHPDGVDGLEAQDIVESSLAQGIEAGEIAAETDRDALVADALAELVGLGALADIEGDPTVRVVVVNHAKAVFVDRGAGVLDPNGRVFATSAAYRRALGHLVATTGHRVGKPPHVSPGLTELRLPDGSVVRILEPGAGADPLLVWRRAATDAPTLNDLVADRYLDAAQEKELAAAMTAGKNVVVCGAHANVLTSALASTWPYERRVVAIGDGTRVALTHGNIARVGAAGLGTIADVLALEPDAVVFEGLEGRAAHLWVETALSSGRPVLALSAEASGEHALKRLALVLELHYGVGGRGGALVQEAVDLVVTMKTEADGSTRVERIEEVEATKDGFVLKAKPRR